MPLIPDPFDLRTAPLPTPPAQPEAPAAGPVLSDTDLGSVAGGSYVSAQHGDWANPFVVNKVGTIFELADEDLARTTGGAFVTIDNHDRINPLAVNK